MSKTKHFCGFKFLPGLIFFILRQYRDDGRQGSLFTGLSGFVGNHLQTDHTIMCLCVWRTTVSSLPYGYLFVPLPVCVSLYLNTFAGIFVRLMCPCTSMCSATGSKEACYSDLLLTSAFGQQVCMCVSVRVCIRVSGLGQSGPRFRGGSQCQGQEMDLS